MTSNDIFNAIARNDSVTVRSLSTRSIDNLGTMLDDKQSTVLHICCNSNNQQSLKFFLEQFDIRAQQQQQFYTLEDKKLWLNRKDKEGLTCLHYSVLAGNFIMTRLLEQHGADIYQINTQGQCVMHIAAQADSPLLLYYFLNKGFRIQVQDFKGSTPLHWACYSGRQNSVNALIAWGAQLNTQDKNYGFTPLHLAVLSADSRITKKLLIRGANKYLKDFHNKVPLDIARQNQYVSIKQMIQDQFGFQILYNLRQPYHKTSKKFSISFLMVVFLLISTFVLNIVFVLNKIETILNIIYIVFSGIPWIFLLLTSFTDPGYLKTNIQTEQLFQLLVHYPPQKICFDCQILKPKRSKHCQICHSCVIVYDHHCPWVNNCIGAKNYIFFYLFIISMQLNIISTFLYSIYSLIEKIDFQNNQTQSILHIATTLYCTVNSLFIIPLTILIIYSTRNCLTDTTTFQKYSQKSKQKRSRSSSSVMMRLRNHTIRSSALLTSSNTSRLINKPILSNQQKILPKTLSIRNCMNTCFKNKQNQLFLYGN